MDDFLKKAYSYAENIKSLYEQKLQLERQGMQDPNLDTALEIMLEYEQKHYATIDNAKIPRYLKYLESQNNTFSLVRTIMLQNEFSVYSRVYTNLNYIFNRQEFIKAINNQDHIKIFVEKYLKKRGFYPPAAYK